MDTFHKMLDENVFRWFLSVGLFFIFAGVGFGSLILPFLVVLFYKLGELPEYVEPEDLVSLAKAKT